jgi:hypothetical protein
VPLLDHEFEVDPADLIGVHGHMIAAATRFGMAGVNRQKVCGRKEWNPVGRTW